MILGDSDPAGFPAVPQPTIVSVQIWHTTAQVWRIKEKTDFESGDNTCGICTEIWGEFPALENKILLNTRS